MKRRKVEDEPIWIPNDIIFNIFLYLDLKTLLKCRLVCKRFDEIQDEDGFVKEYFSKIVNGKSFKTKPIPELLKIGNVKLNLKDEHIDMHVWGKKINKTNHQKVEIKRFVIRLFIPIFGHHYMFVLQSKSGFSWYSIFCEIERCQKIAFTDSVKKHGYQFCGGIHKSVKKGEVVWYDSIMYVDTNHICNGLHFDGNKLYLIF